MRLEVWLTLDVARTSQLHSNSVCNKSSERDRKSGTYNTRVTRKMHREHAGALRNEEQLFTSVDQRWHYIVNPEQVIECHVSTWAKRIRKPDFHPQQETKTNSEELRRRSDGHACLLVILRTRILDWRRTRGRTRRGPATQGSRGRRSPPT